MTYSAVFSKKDNCIQSPFWHLNATPAVILTHTVTRENFIFVLLSFWISSIFLSLRILSLIYSSAFSSFQYFFCSRLSCSSLFTKCFSATCLALSGTRPHREKSRLTVALLKHHTAYSTRALLWSERDREKRANEQKVRNKRKETWEKGVRHKKRQHHLRT